MGAFILGNLPEGSAETDVKTDFEILSSLTSKVLSGAKATELGKAFLLFMLFRDYKMFSFAQDNSLLRKILFQWETT